MPRKEFVRLLEENVMTLDRLGDRLRLNPADLSGFPRQQLAALVRLHLGGRAKLKDIARREHVTSPNLCAMFRKLEHDGFVLRTIDEKDRRNTWYSVTPAGNEIAKNAIAIFRAGIEALFSNISVEDEETLTGALKTINDLLKKMEKNNAKN